MKRLLYVSFENSKDRASGVNKKIFGQLKVFEGEGFSTDLIARYENVIAFFHGDSEAEIINTKNIWRSALCGWAAKHATDYDVAYIRFQFFCPFVLQMVHSFRIANVKTIMEIPTYPYVPELKKQGMVGVPKLLIDSIFRKLCAMYIDRFAVPLYDEPIMGIKCIEIHNGIEVDEIKARTPRKPDGIVNLLAVAMMAPWHGYDRLINGINMYYSNGGNREVVLHLVGEGTATPVYNTLINEYNLSNHVIQHGKMHGKELDEMYNKADIGVGSLGIHRTEIKKTNTLKIMEYMAKGIPVICEHSELGIPLTSKFRLTVSDDENSIDLFKVLEFYDSLYVGTKISNLVNSIRNECRDNCNIKAGLSEVLKYMKQ